MDLIHDLQLFPLIREPRSRWERAGLTARQERNFNRATIALVVMFLSGWIYTLGFASDSAFDPSRTPAAPLTTALIRDPLSPEAPFVLDEFIRSFEKQMLAEVGGLSGAVRARIVAPGEVVDLPGDSTLPAGAAVVFTDSAAAQTSDAGAGTPNRPGIWNVMIRMRDAIRPASDVQLITMMPLSAKQGGRIGRYLIGNWPYESGGAPRAIYRPPQGLIEVTPQNMNTWLSQHIQLKDFITKGQENVWPKYVAVQPKILDKIELVLQELGRMGHPVTNIFAVSGFRTPAYNAGGGNTAGRGALSRHMYGDAMDIAVDNDQNRIMDDLNGDGRIDLKDARIIGEAVDRVERRYPQMVGGMHYYPPTGGHQGMVHIDTRGYRARW
jgi:uncharacterized protein YcbK (DUF882 family)